MNANELADNLDKHYDFKKKFPQTADDVIVMLRQQQVEIEEWKRKYKDMHNLATQAMSKVHELEKAQQI